MGFGSGRGSEADARAFGRVTVGFMGGVRREKVVVVVVQCAPAIVGGGGG